MRSPNTQSSQVQFQQNTAPYFVSHLDSMSSHKLTLHSHYYGPMQRLCHPAHFLISSLEPMQRLCHPVPYGPMQRLCHPAHLFLYFFINLLPEPMHVCIPAHVWTLQRLAIRSTALTSYNFLFRFVSEPMQRLCHPVPYGPMQRLCHPAHFSLSLSLSFVVCQNHFNSGSFHGTNRHTLNDSVHHAQIQNIQTQIANLKSQIPSFAFLSLSHKPAQKLHYRSTLLSGSSAKFQCCKSHWTPCQLSGSTRCKSTRPKIHKGTLQGQITPQFILFANYTGNHHYKDHKAHLTAKIGLQISPCSSIHLERHVTVRLL